MFIGKVDRIIGAQHKITQQERWDFDMFEEKFSGILVLACPFRKCTAETPCAYIGLNDPSRVIAPDDIRPANTEFGFPATGKIDRCGKVSAVAGYDPF